MSKTNAVWSFLISVRLAIVLLILIALASVLGTLIPQQEAAGPFISRLAPGTADLMRSLQLFGIFQSAWFILLLGLLALNLIACSLSRMPATWRRFRQKSRPDREDLFDDIPAGQRAVTAAPLPEEIVRIEALLKKKGRLTRRDSDDRCYLHVEKGSYSYFGVYLIHASVLIVMAGFIIGSFYGFEGHMHIPEGESSSVVILKGGQQLKRLDIAVRCDRFFIDFYENGTPRTYRSDLTFLEGERMLQSASVLVNHPVTFGGMRFYQSSYGTAPAGDPVLSVLQDGRKIRDVKLAIGMDFELPEKKAMVQIIRVEENFMDMGPAVKLHILSPERHIQLWVFQAIDQIARANPGLLEQIPLFNPGAFKPYLFTLQESGRGYYTGLQVARDPGVPVAAAGGVLMMIGFMVVFFSSHRQIWVRLDKAADKTRICIAGRSNRDAVGLKRNIRQLMDTITQTKGSAK